MEKLLFFFFFVCAVVFFFFLLGGHGLNPKFSLYHMHFKKQKNCEPRTLAFLSTNLMRSRVPSARRLEMDGGRDTPSFCLKIDLAPSSPSRARKKNELGRPQN
eukprot:TRINITY_DN9967_c1_g1_i1.p1 TRINITY_DN9967_c1_g1~~TRINITY_DN9967_c1_g1_i1.p1  ORF type:complete len:103 (-),score=6.73 TRINITY_DN9967_c1_g1_i1:1512-1820(-)